MTLKVLARIFQLLVLIVFLAGQALPAHAEPSSAPVNSNGISAVIPGVKLLGAWVARNKTYSSAEEYIAERNAYYDQLRETLRKKYQEHVKATLQNQGDAQTINPLRKSQLAAYIKAAALIESQRTSELAFAEAIKKGARKDFNQAVKEEIRNRIMATGMVQQVFNSINSGFGQAQQFIDKAIGKLETGGSVDLTLRKLRTITDRLNTASSIFGGTFFAGMRDTLANLTGKIERQSQLTKEDLVKTRTELNALNSRLTELQQSGQVPAASNEVLADLGMELLGWGPGTPATQAIINLLSNRAGLSTAQIRERGMALLQAGNLARCRSKADALIKALQQLKQESGGDVKIQPPEALCNEINAQHLLDQTNPVPQQTPNTTGTESNPADNDFTADGCKCGEFEVSEAIPRGNASLTCNFEWTGESGVLNQLSFEVSRVYHLDEQNPAFQTEIEDLLYKKDGISADQKATELVNDGTDYAMVITGPGGISSTTNQEIPMCGNGNEVYAYGDYLISTSIFACDLGPNEQDYIDAMETIAQCAMNSVDSKYP
jgi:hypothetical protein